MAQLAHGVPSLQKTRARGYGVAVTYLPATEKSAVQSRLTTLIFRHIQQPYITICHKFKSYYMHSIYRTVGSAIVYMCLVFSDIEICRLFVYNGGKRMRAAVYAGTRNIYENMIPSMKSLLIHSNVEKIYFLIEDDKFPYELPPEVECINVSN